MNRHKPDPDTECIFTALMRQINQQPGSSLRPVVLNVQVMWSARKEKKRKKYLWSSLQGHHKCHQCNVCV